MSHVNLKSEDLYFKIFFSFIKDTSVFSRNQTVRKRKVKPLPVPDSLKRNWALCPCLEAKGCGP